MLIPQSNDQQIQSDATGSLHRELRGLQEVHFGSVVMATSGFPAFWFGIGHSSNVSSWGNYEKKNEKERKALSWCLSMHLTAKLYSCSYERYQNELLEGATVVDTVPRGIV